MFKPTVTEDDIRRLRAEREEADRRYNEALTAVDAALQRLPAQFPRRPAGLDEAQIAALNDRWQVVPDRPVTMGGWRGRLAGFVWRVVGPMLQRQQEFNFSVVDHVNRNLAGHQQARQALGEAIEILRDEFAGLVHFQARLITYLQQFTLYIDTKDRESAGLIRQTTDMLDERTIGLGNGLSGLANGLSGLGNEWAIRWESATAREQRYHARAEAQERATSEFHTRLGLLQQSSKILKRELERILTSGMTAAAPVATSAAGATAVGAAGAPAFVTAALESYKYVSFEDQFRGARSEIRARLTDYLPLFEGASDIVDIGCGRGEFLDLLRENRITARGVDSNHEMVEVCRERGLDVAEGDALGYLRTLPDGALGGLLAAQVVEHLEPDYLTALLETAYDKLRPGSRIVLETINPTCWAAFFESYLRDLTHVRPLHPDTLKYLLQASGFQRVEVRLRAPYPEHAKLQPVVVPRATGERDLEAVVQLAETFNSNVERINSLLFSYLDYAAVGERV